MSGVDTQKNSSWEMNAWKKLIANETAPTHVSENDRQLLYILSQHGTLLTISLFSVRLKKSGGFAKSGRLMYNWGAPADFSSREIREGMSEGDWGLISFITKRMSSTNYSKTLSLDFPQSGEALKRIIETGRCYYEMNESVPLKWGAAKQGKLEWTYGLNSNRYQIVFRAEGLENRQILTALEPICYFDSSTDTVGFIESSDPSHIVKKMLSAPPMPPEEVPHLQGLLLEKAPQLAHLAPTLIKEILVHAHPKPRVRFIYSEQKVSHPYGQRTQNIAIIGAEVFFDYDGWIVPMPTVFIQKSFKTAIQKGLEVAIIDRSMVHEKALTEQLVSLGWQTRPSHYNLCCNFLFFDDNLGVIEAALEIVSKHATHLKQQGWVVEIDPSFPVKEVCEVEEWYLEGEEESKNDWLDVKMGVLINGERINLLPTLLMMAESLVEHDHDFDIATVDKELKIPLLTQDKKVILVPIHRVHSIIHHLLVEFSSKPKEDKSDSVRISKWQAAFLEEVVKGEKAAAGRWVSSEKLKLLTSRLQEMGHVDEVPCPQGLQCSLRPYQKEGLNWMQLLSQCDMNGILADDMGLGKTVQALAHLLVEKESGRMQHPSIVIAPTSLMPNWFNEARRFAPSLKVLVLHGDDRKDHFSKILEHDLILTTYPLLMRDKEFLLQHQFHLMILDEAQALKNFKTQSYQVVQQIKARHTICLSGTPMENHLGELWSLFHLLVPGYLGDQKTFQSLFRKPIETHHNDSRKQSLAKRIKPFILRRTKQQVALELPAKTEIIQKIELKDAQRDLYEGIRLRAQKKVMTHIQEKGIARSQIIVLDALLKLRQVCCDPRLVKMEEASCVEESAKLEFLMEMLSQLVEEDKKVLVFSQFTSMLALIAKALSHQSIAYTMLTGDTKDRETPVSLFQAGNVPIMLISLKAGGVGLNLTAADTVIHYDPWWNPAAENQATDRAHRIGQTKPVFVYKLVVAGSLEEKILALQERKKGLVQALLDPESGMGATLSLEDLESIFQPLA